MRSATFLASATMFALSVSAAPLGDADKAALNGTWMVKPDDPALKGEQGEFLARFALTFNMGVGKGYVQESMEPNWTWWPVASAESSADGIAFAYAGGDAAKPFTIALTGDGAARMMRDGKMLQLARVRPPEELDAPEFLEAMALRLSQGSSGVSRFVALKSPGEDRTAACRDETRPTLEFDLLSPFSWTVFVKQDYDIAGYGILALRQDDGPGTLTINVSPLAGAISDRKPAETWAISGLGNEDGSITLMPSGLTFADCTGPLR